MPVSGTYRATKMYRGCSETVDGSNWPRNRLPPSLPSRHPRSKTPRKPASVMKFCYWGTLASVILVLIAAVVLLYAFRAYSPGSAGRQVPQTTLTANPSASALVSEPIDAGLRTSCATRVLTALVDAINSHDEAVLGRIIASGQSATQAFQWVSLTTSSEVGAVPRGSGVNEVDYTSAGARLLLLRHGAQGERWTLETVRASDGPSWHGGVDAEVHLERQLADGRVVKTGGKTALSCIGSAIYVLSLGDN